jgi:ABC-type dipeptide/oligopeptide/nickel transport system permease component
MSRYLLGRLVELILVLFGVSTLLFFLLRLSGDPVVILAGPNATPEMRDQMRQELGFNDPLATQYLRFLQGATRLDFGQSLRFRSPAMSEIFQRLPATLELTVAAMLLTVIVAVPAGMYAALWRGRLSGTAVMLTALVGQAMPSFWLGAVLILIFSVRLGWLPSFGSGTPLHVVLPAVTLSAFFMAKLARLTRSGMLEIMHHDYVVTARGKGLSEFLVLRRHILRNMLIPLITVLGLDVGFLMGGAVIVESVFAWPGIGRQLVDAVFTRDYPIVQATVFVVAAMVVLINLAVDIAYRWLDPRVGFR